NEQIRQLDLLQGMRATLQTQASAEPMLRMLDKLAALPDLPPLLQTAMRQVLTHVATPEHLSTTSGIAQAIRQSGVFLEAGLGQLNRALQAGNTTQSAQPAADQPSQNFLPPLARLLPLLSSLATPPGTEPLPGADFKASLLTLLITLQQHLPPDANKALTLPPGPWQAALTVKPGLFPLPPRALQALTDTPDLGSLLRLTAALLSRIQHHQFQSLGQTQTFADGSTQTVWQLEIPLRDGQQFSQVQMRIQRDSNAPDERQTEQAPQWEIRLAFNLEQLGPMQAIARLYKGRVSSEFWAEQADTLQRISHQMDRLRDRLLTRGLDVGELSCHRGSPPEPRQAVQQRWIDEVT
ncbi:MAG: flagellar hook-length control protein FliK, partial [Pseudomonas sp.]